MKTDAHSLQVINDVLGRALRDMFEQGASLRSASTYEYPYLHKAYYEVGRIWQRARQEQLNSMYRQAMADGETIPKKDTR